MSSFSIVVALYFSLSALILSVTLYVKDKKGIRWNMPILFIVVILLFGPILFLVDMILDVIYPASGDPFDIIYGKLSYVEGKTIQDILEEIRSAGETLGWAQEAKLDNMLRMMTSFGYAKCKLVSIRINLDGVTAKISELRAQSWLQGVVDTEELEKAIQGLAQEINDLERENGPFLVPFYYKGTPPKPRRKKIRKEFFVPWRWAPA